jgi:S-adenosylmethionine decarboxylase
MNQEIVKPFGYLLTLDLYRCRSGACEDIDLCYRFLDELVGHLHMQRQSPPWIFQSDAKKYPDKAGLSGWIPLIESGIQIHTLIPKRFISIDIYSCGEFDRDDLKKFVKPYFAPEEVESHFILRGVKYNVRKE